MDATWGEDEDRPKEHGDNTFRFTKCTPQFVEAARRKPRLIESVEDIRT